LREEQFFRRRFTTLLLDQQFLAGMGNYLRSEVMFVAQIHPSLRPRDCSDRQIKRVAETALKLTRQSYQTRGITNDLELAERLRQQGYSRSEYRFWVFNRDGASCFVCDTSIVKEIVGGRRFYYCPTCQEEPKGS
jgi:endonuclease-8